MQCGLHSAFVRITVVEPFRVRGSIGSGELKTPAPRCERVVQNPHLRSYLGVAQVALRTVRNNVEIYVHDTASDIRRLADRSTVFLLCRSILFLPIHDGTALIRTAEPV